MGIRQFIDIFIDWRAPRKMNRKYRWPCIIVMFIVPYQNKTSTCTSCLRCFCLAKKILPVSVADYLLSWRKRWLFSRVRLFIFNFIYLRIRTEQTQFKPYKTPFKHSIAIKNMFQCILTLHIQFQYIFSADTLC